MAPVFYACGYNDGLDTPMNPAHKTIWEMYSEVGTVIDIKFPRLPDSPGNWFDASHAKGYMGGRSIIGPLVAQIWNDQAMIKRDTPLTIAILGDSTTAYCTQPTSNVGGVYTHRWYLNHKQKWSNVKSNQTSRRRSGLDICLQECKIPHDQIVVEYYAVSGKQLDRSAGGFLHQLGCCKRDNRADIILMVGGWNNMTVCSEDLQTFRTFLSEDNVHAREVVYWGEDVYRGQMVEQEFPPNTRYPLL